MKNNAIHKQHTKCSSVRTAAIRLKGKSSAARCTCIHAPFSSTVSFYAGRHFYATFTAKFTISSASRLKATVGVMQPVLSHMCVCVLAR